MVIESINASKSKASHSFGRRLVTLLGFNADYAGASVFVEIG